MAAELVLDALKNVWLSLESLNVPRAVMGGLALAAWGHVRATRDVACLSASQQRTCCQCSGIWPRPGCVPSINLR